MVGAVRVESTIRCFRVAYIKNAKVIGGLRRPDIPIAGGLRGKTL